MKQAIRTCDWRNAESPVVDIVKKKHGIKEVRCEFLKDEKCQGPRKPENEVDCCVLQLKREPYIVGGAFFRELKDDEMNKKDLIAENRSLEAELRYNQEAFLQKIEEKKDISRERDRAIEEIERVKELNKKLRKQLKQAKALKARFKELLK